MYKIKCYKISAQISMFSKSLRARLDELKNDNQYEKNWRLTQKKEL